MKLRELVNQHKEEILRIMRKYGAYNVRLFGSVANGKERPDSDIDFLITLEQGRSMLDLGGILMDLQDILHHPVDVVTEKGIKQRIRSRVLREAIPL